MWLQNQKTIHPFFQKFSYTIYDVIFLLQISYLKILYLVSHIHIRCDIYCINISIISSLRHII
jgi:hypothetical protein